MKVIIDANLWKKYLDEVCILRGKVYIEEGLYAKDILTREGKFEEVWDSFSMHTIALDDGKVVGGIRVTVLSENGQCHDGEVDCFLKKLKLRKHARTYRALLQQLAEKRKKVTEVARLFVAEDYRRFINPQSNVGLNLIVLTYSYFTDNGVEGVFIIQGNKYKTGRIYEKMGFSNVIDVDDQKPLEPFLEFNDVCTLMYMETSRISQLFSKFVEGLKRSKPKVTIISKQGS